jgi:hypothetical protein
MTARSVRLRPGFLPLQAVDHPSENVSTETTHTQRHDQRPLKIGPGEGVMVVRAIMMVFLAWDPPSIGSAPVR